MPAPPPARARCIRRNRRGSWPKRLPGCRALFLCRKESHNMPAEIRVPALGESVVEATVGKWLKNVGDAVTTGDPLVSLETDKVDMEVAAEQAGVLARIDKAAGDTVAVGEVLGSLSVADAVPTENGSKPPAVSASTPTQTQAQPVAD